MKKYMPILFAFWYFVMYDVTGGPLVTTYSPAYKTRQHCELARDILYNNFEVPGARLYKTTICKSLRQGATEHMALQPLDKHLNEWYK